MNKEKLNKKTCAKIKRKQLCHTRIAGDSFYLTYPPCGCNEYDNNTNGDDSSSYYNDSDNNDNNNGNTDHKTKNINPFVPWNPLFLSLYRPTFKQQYLENGESKHCILKEYSISFLMISRLIDFALAVL